jgi:hypothetical protein
MTAIPQLTDFAPHSPQFLILDYLEHRLQGYPFDPDLDAEFVFELLEDFPHLDILEQIKLWRWYHNGHPPLQRQPRAALRRWIARAMR